MSPETEMIANVSELKPDPEQETDLDQTGDGDSEIMVKMEKMEPEIDGGATVPEVIQPLPEVDEHVTIPEVMDDDIARIYVCPHCTVRFSSISTLEAHVTHYCTGARDAMVAPSRQTTPSEKLDDDMDVDDDSHQPMKKRRRFSVASQDTATTGSSGKSSADEKEKDEETSKPFRCPHCSFVSAKRTNLHCHMRNMHRNPYKNQDSDHDEMTIPELFCTDCKIQFSATKTFTAHKTYYCRKRKPSDDIRVPVLNQINAMNALTPPMFVTPMMLPNGAGSVRLPVLMQPVFVPVETRENKEEPVQSQDHPLDLTVKKDKNTVDKNQNDINKSDDRSDQHSRNKTPPETLDQVDGSSKQGYNICSSCKIVFYKFENYMIHKKYYCSGREAENSENGDIEEQTSPLNVACVPCNITFKSQVTLEAHQQYYCPHRERSSDPNEDTSCMYICQKCGREYATPKLFRMHFCDKGKQAPTSDWNLHRCHKCNFVTHKETAFVEHMRKHTSVNGYRCKLCGYKGNTVRGMRMHGKMMHPVHGDSFMEMYVIELHRLQPEMDSEPKVDPDLETEIIRLKSEPYKRRRSKYHRHIENGDNVDVSKKVEQVTFKCNVCDITFTGSSDDHMKEYHREIKTASREEEDNRFTVKEEVDDLSEEDEELDPVSVDDKDIVSPRGSDVKVESQSPKPSTAHVRSPGFDEETRERKLSLSSNDENSMDSESRIEPDSSKHCNNCNITFKFTHSLLAHKKYYCRGRVFAPPRPVVFSPPLATVD